MNHTNIWYENQIFEKLDCRAHFFWKRKSQTWKINLMDWVWKSEMKINEMEFKKGDIREGTW